VTALPSTTPRLVERDDFDQLVRIVADDVGLLPHWVRKDYWVVRVLDALVRSPAIAERFLFKGGTSLSKAWKLIDRFSEDIDLLLTGPRYGPVPGKKDREKTLKEVRAAIEQGTPLRLPLEGLSEPEKTLYYVRADYHGRLRYPISGATLAKGSPSQDWVLVEAGFRGSPRPMTTVPIQSYIGEYLEGRTEQAALAREYASDVLPVPVPVLAPERTFVEKILAIHTAAVSEIEELQGRHYYDLARLYEGHPDVRRCLDEPSVFRELLAEAMGVSNLYYGQTLDLATIDLGKSPALLPSQEVREVLATKWRAEASLYPKGQPRLEDVLVAIGEIRARMEAALRSS
jgi:predicted nucleotidyltransferase component of viral defense system